MRIVAMTVASAAASGCFMASAYFGSPWLALLGVGLVMVTGVLVVRLVESLGR